MAGHGHANEPGVKGIQFQGGEEGRAPFVCDSLCRYLYSDALMHVDISIWLSNEEIATSCEI